MTYLKNTCQAQKRKQGLRKHVRKAVPNSKVAAERISVDAADPGSIVAMRFRQTAVSRANATPQWVECARSWRAERAGRSAVDSEAFVERREEIEEEKSEDSTMLKAAG